MLVTRRHVRIATALLTLLGCGYLVQALRLPFGDPGGTGSGGTPVAIGLLWVICGAYLVVRTPPVHVHDEEVGTWPDPGQTRRLGFVLVLCVGFLLALPVLGLLATAALFMVAMARFCDASWPRSIAVSLLASAALWLVFVKGLQLTFPVGLLFSGRGG